MATFSESPVVPFLAVDDLERAVAFYRDRLGLQVEVMPDEMQTAMVHAGGESWLGLYKSDFKRGETTVASFLVGDVSACVEELRGRGVVFEEYDLPGLKTEDGIASWGTMQTAWFKDSEGNIVAVSTRNIAEEMRKAA